ncbi:MAG: type II secretion system F family protein [Gammaproteobacteria bacterium]|nr:type II secretion system F family protein [Gammaproteobacteria bacterium]
MAQTAQQLTTFVWEGVDRGGRTVKGENQGPSTAYVTATLRRQGIKPVRVRKKPKPLFSRRRPVKAKDIAVITRQLSTMISAGIPIAQSFDILARGHENPVMQNLLNGIRQDVEAGTSLSDSLRRYPAHFDDLYRNLVSAGEQSGTLDALMDKIATYKEKIEALKSKIRSALFYPTTVLLVAVVVTAILLIFVIPTFEELFKSFGAELPSLTQLIIELSQFFQEWWWAIFGTMIGAIVALSILYKRSASMRYTLDRILLRLPILGQVMKKATIARFSRTLATMFGAGVPLVDGLEAVAGASGNRVYYNAVLDIRSDVSTGQQLALSMESTGLFPNMVLQMVSIGEESGELELMLTKVADFYEQEVDDAVAALSSLIEPAIIIFLGLVVGTMVVAMYLPIFKMAAVF